MKKWYVLWTIMQIAMSWYSEAEEDGYITDDEVAELVKKIADGVDYKWKI